MNLLRRLKTLWILSELEVSKEDNRKTVKIGFNPPEEKPIHMAQIIKMRDPIKELLKEDDKTIQK